MASTAILYNMDQILKEFSRLWEERVTGEELVEAVVEIISRYNLEERYEERQKWAEVSWSERRQYRLDGFERCTTTDFRARRAL